MNFTLSQDHRVGGPNPEIPVPPAGTIGEGGSANARACLVTAGALLSLEGGIFQGPSLQRASRCFLHLVTLKMLGR